ncbi:ASCH domain-containing protein [Paraburkholderia fungorum]|uniref:ASCH domain-containing protein n=1 Tax=Paraburkholderia fungorum TaxID=134537 RepID=A0AAP5UWJ6_9BURK|nr:ASCH domain-containing protein [Paraburkholderia fungorum]MDT8841031.1 ASCH domain-containing protein [Paraburkholderia fungorum]PRZ56347.1 ASCH domain-containing protein [Paraburkholderia fungorum]
MKALSIRQPWAWLIVNGYKDIENRSWTTRFRGRVLIHASKGMTRAEYEDACEPTRLVGSRTIELPPFGQLQRGGIVGAATIDACISSGDRTSQWHIEGCYGFHLTDIKPLPFVACKGALRFFDVPADDTAQLHQTHDLGALA